MTYVAAALCGGLFGTIGPGFYGFGYSRGHHLADGSRFLERTLWVFPAAILFLGFLRADRDHPRALLAARITTLVVNVVFYILLAMLLLYLWRIVFGSPWAAGLGPSAAPP